MMSFSSNPQFEFTSEILLRPGICMCVDRFGSLIDALSVQKINVLTAHIFRHVCEGRCPAVFGLCHEELD